MSAATSGGLKSFRSPPIVGMMDGARTVIVSGIVTAALMKYRTKTATSWTEAIRRHGERRQRTSWARRIPDRAEDRRGCSCPVRARPVRPRHCHLQNGGASNQIHNERIAGADTGRPD